MQESEVKGGLWWALGAALAARLGPALFGFEHYGDSPVRIEAAERWAAHPHLWRGFVEAFQYGPLHLTLLGAFGALLGDRVAGARALSLVCGLAGVALLHRLAYREVSERSAFWAALALALSPLHIQASTTGASEAVFLALFLGALALLLEDHVVWAAVLLGAAGLVRYDGWMYLPLFALLHFWRKRDVFRALGFACLAAAPALFWMWVNAKYAGDALAPIHWIDHDHRELAQMALHWFGQLRWRAYGLVYWPLAVLVIATPILGGCALLGSFRALRLRERGWDLLALAWLPAAYLTFRTAVLADFRPMARFAMVPAAMSLMFVHLEKRWLRIAAVAVLVATPVALFAASWNREGALAEWARPLSPVSSLPPGIAQASQWLKQNARKDDVVLLDGVWDYLDIPLAFAAGLPDEQWIRASWVDDFEARLTRHDPTLAVLIYQGKLGDWTKDEYEFRGMKFCLAQRFQLASIYRRCQR